MRFDVASFANSAAASNLSGDLDDENIDEDAPYIGLRPRSTIIAPTIYTSSPLVQTKRVKNELALVSLFEVQESDIGIKFCGGGISNSG